MKTVTIGFVREDGDIQVLATMNNNDELINEKAFNILIERMRRDLQMYCDTHRLEIFEREDAPDYVTPEGESKMNDTNDDLTLKAALLMEKMGGSFAAAIAKAWIVGDGSNKPRVYAAFPELFEKYTAWALEDSK